MPVVDDGFDDDSGGDSHYQQMIDHGGPQAERDRRWLEHVEMASMRAPRSWRCGQGAQP
jgi:hypothetical protein